MIIYNRSLTGEGTKKTLYEIKKNLKKLKITSVSSGYKVFDWQFPKEKQKISQVSGAVFSLRINLIFLP